MANGPVLADFAEDTARTADVITEVRREEALLKTGALQDAIFNRDRKSVVLGVTGVQTCALPISGVSGLRRRYRPDGGRDHGGPPRRGPAENRGLARRNF